MFGKIGLPELVLILVIALIIFGPRKLPDIGRSIGRGIREFRQATTEISKTVSLDDDEEDEKTGVSDKQKVAEHKEKEESNKDDKTEVTASEDNQAASEDTQADQESEKEENQDAKEDEKEEQETIKSTSAEEIKQH